ncbi:MAG: hypothetical protein ACRDRA_10115 [Pseudonocardiaceae bacterium]
MTVHIDELHSDVVPTGGGSASSGEARRRDEPEWMAQQRWSEARCRSDWLAQRVCAVDFDD